ncbi:MAG: hypothetical protein HN834_00025 [Rhodospirillaceae bacterium]|jgi:integrase|nr:hypothetical protein [Rhodospirillaceae bacterium]
MRYRLPSGEWERRSTKSTDLDEAKAIALEEYQTELIKEKSGIPSSKKTLRYFAEKQIENLNRSIAAGKQAATFTGYILTINKWIIPILGEHKIGSINAAAIKQFENTREELHKGPASKSMINTHNVVLRGILRLAVEQRYIKSSDIPILTTKGKGAARRSRPPFSSDEIFTMKRRFVDWVDDAVGDDAKYRRQLLAYYTEFLAATGIRPGEEALGVKWKHISTYKPKIDYDEIFRDPVKQAMRSIMDKFLVDDDIVKVIVTNGKIHNRSDAKQQRIVIARDDIKTTLSNIRGLTHRTDDEDYVFATQMGKPMNGFSPMFTKFLNECGLLYTSDERRRVLYSIRHYYTNMTIKKDNLPMIVIAQNMGTSLEMIEDYYADNMVEDFAETLSK